jgi:hypothetical protein
LKSRSECLELKKYYHHHNYQHGIGGTDTVHYSCDSD